MNRNGSRNKNIFSCKQNHLPVTLGRPPLHPPFVSSYLSFLFFFFFFKSSTSHPSIRKMSAQARGKAKEKPIASLLAGATAGGVEAFITFPLESIKTQLQFGALDGGKVGSLVAH